MVDSRQWVIALPGPWGLKEDVWGRGELGLSVSPICSVCSSGSDEQLLCPLVSSPKRVAEHLRSPAVCGTPFSVTL